MRFIAVLLVVVFVGCDRGAVRPVLGDVELSARSLHFDLTFVGFPTARSLVLRNGSRSDRAVTLSTTGPFSTALELNVPGGAQAELVVAFSPALAGQATGTLRLSDGKSSFEVALDGQGLLVPACTPSSPCLSSAFDPLLRSCVEAPVTDGLACVSTNACFLGGACVKGVCLGSARDCADSDRCTLDACDPTGGCLHLPTACAAPLDPCKVAHCDPLLGCVQTDAQDGTACGAADCQTARICMLGQCKAVPVPDGATCAAASPCQGAGICAQQTCVRPAATSLVEAWNYAFPGVPSGFQGVSDAAENLYWVECAFGGLAGTFCDACTMCAATSYTRDGQLRFRKLLNGVGPEPQPRHLLLGNQLIYSVGHTVGALSIADGSVVWTRDLDSSGLNPPDAATSLEVAGLVSDATGVWVLGRRHHGNPQSQNRRSDVLIKLGPTGAVIFTRFFQGSLQAAVVDEHDRLYVSVYPLSPIDAPLHLISTAASGTERWDVELPNDQQVPVAVFNGELIMNDGAVRSTIDGTMLVAGPKLGRAEGALMGPGSRTLVFENPSTCCPTCPCALLSNRVEALRLKASSPVIDWQTIIASSVPAWPWKVSDPVATRQGELLLAATSLGDRTHLVAVNSTGASRFACEIEPTLALSAGITALYGSPVALLSGRWAVVEEIECQVCERKPDLRLRVFEVPGERPTRQGWVGARGSPSGGSRPLP